MQGGGFTQQSGAVIVGSQTFNGLVGDGNSMAVNDRAPNVACYDGDKLCARYFPGEAIPVGQSNSVLAQAARIAIENEIHNIM